MKTKNKIPIALIMIISVFSISGVKHIKEQRYTTENATFNLLIGGVTSEFKQGIISRLVDHYKDHGNVDLVDISNLDQVECGDYDAIVVMESRQAWTLFNVALKSFLEKTESCQNIVLLFTAGDPDWEYQFHGLDAVTSASRVENEKRVFNELTYKIDLILSKKNRHFHPKKDEMPG